ncbi:LAME_0C05556g1_1 [Lachancea meyersii CBS 8951]|uniref:LAME_0C05556g1_1 n=1 Tax=Lachancea meyersii CBS 8951 TaxID=1266667 RepID=A0A1G4J1P6_9SACH|nr:LAME_0C05556g1_1 [Lachancea meyersii CBS 8951]
MSDISASEYINQQNALEDEAREIMPWNPSHCTYVDGGLRQPVFACLSCGEIGVCYSCSIQCHANCELIELFTKRAFTCDCGTERQLAKPKKDNEYWCQLRKNTTQDIPSLSNSYGPNFKGYFCDCHKQYDPESDSTMIQCALGLECNEDWYHCACIVQTQNQIEEGEKPSNPTEQSLPLGFPSLESFDAFICWKCASRYKSVFRDLLAHSRSQDLIAHKIKHSSPASEKSEPNTGNSVDGLRKRKYDMENDESFSLMLLPGYKSVLLEIKAELEKTSKLYLFMDDIAPFLTEDEPVYVPPEDSDDDASTYELGTQALSSTVDRDVAAVGLRAMDGIKQKLSEFLQPFADSGQIVKEEDIRNFFKLQNKE